MLRTESASSRPDPTTRAFWPLLLVLVLLLAARALLQTHVEWGSSTLDTRISRSQV